MKHEVLLLCLSSVCQFLGDREQRRKKKTELFRSYNDVFMFFFLQIAKRFQDSWISSVAEAESVLPERPKLASSNSPSIDDTFHDSSTSERENKACPAFALSTSPETSHVANGSTSVTITTPTSTLKKSSGKKKPGKSSKDLRSKHSIKTLGSSPDRSDGGAGECPYSDLDSVPKILCPKALERQPKLVLTQPSAIVVKEVKKQPEPQSGLWFSKSSKDRRPKTSPMPDRTLFSKAPCKRKRSSSSKKILVPTVSSSGGQSDQSGSSDKRKTLVAAETNPPPEEPGHLKCKNTQVAFRPFGSTADPSGSSNKQRPLVSVEKAVPFDKSQYSQCGQRPRDPGTPSVQNTVDPSMEAAFSDQSRFLESKNSPTERPHTTSNKKVNVIDTISDQAVKKESSTSRALSSNTESSDELRRLEKQKSLVSKCRLPFVKLIRKDIKGKKFLDSSLTIVDQPGCTKNEKTPDNIVSSKRPPWVDSKASASIDPPKSIKVSVKKLKAQGGTGVLRLSSESSQEKPPKPPKVKTVALDSQAAEGPPANVTFLSSAQEDQSESKKSPPSSETGICPDQFEQKNVSTTSTSQPSHRQRNSGFKSCHVSSKKSKKAVYKLKRVSEEVLREQPAHLPASSRLMTRALKAMKEAEQKKQEKTRKEAEHKELLNPLGKAEDAVCHSPRNSAWNPKPKLDFCAKTRKSNRNESGEYDQDTFSSCSTPSVVFSDSADVKSEDEDLSISSTPPMDFIPLTSRAKTKKDHPPSVCTSSKPSSPFSFMNAFKNVEEVSFQSLPNESDGKPIRFKADTNYKFSTFLMMLKDLHDTRERDGAPLELEIGPPSAHVKEEPLVMPGEADPAGQHKLVHKSSNSSLEKTVITLNEDSSVQVLRRPYSRSGGSSGVKKKANRKVPCRSPRSGPGFPGIESSPGVDYSTRVQSLLDLQIGSWERPAGGGEGPVDEETEEKRWSRVNEELQIMVPLEQRGSDTTLCLGQLNGFVPDCPEANTSSTFTAGGADEVPAGKCCCQTFYLATRLNCVTYNSRS